MSVDTHEQIRISCRTSDPRFARDDAPPARPIISPCAGRGLSRVDPDFVQDLRTMLRAQTADCVMETFGISFTTWAKLRKGEPIRTSVAERLVERLNVGR